MRISRSTLVGTAVAVALFGGNAFAQQTTASQSDASKTNSDDSATLQEVVVTGPPVLSEGLDRGQAYQHGHDGGRYR